MNVRPYAMHFVVTEGQRLMIWVPGPGNGRNTATTGENMLIDGKRIYLSAGIGILTEIKNRKRQIVEYLLSSVYREGSGILRERKAKYRILRKDF